MDISKYISDCNALYRKKILLRKISLILCIVPFPLICLLVLLSAFIDKGTAYFPIASFLLKWLTFLPVIGLIVLFASNKKYKNVTPVDKYIIHSYGFKMPGNLHEEVGIFIKDAVYYYYTLSEYDRMNAGGNSAKVPDVFVSGQDIDINGLLIHIAKEYPYMESLQPKKQMGSGASTVTPAAKYTNANLLKEKFRNYIKNEEIWTHLTFSDLGIYADFYPANIPYIEYADGCWKCVTSFDDMRGPLGICNHLSEDAAMTKLSEALSFCMRNIETFYCYHPEWKDKNVSR